MQNIRNVVSAEVRRYTLKQNENRELEKVALIDAPFSAELLSPSESLAPGKETKNERKLFGLSVPVITITRAESFSPFFNNVELRPFASLGTRKSCLISHYGCTPLAFLTTPDGNNLIPWQEGMPRCFGFWSIVCFDLFTLLLVRGPVVGNPQCKHRAVTNEKNLESHFRQQNAGRVIKINVARRHIFIRLRMKRVFLGPVSVHYSELFRIRNVPDS